MLKKMKSGNAGFTLVELIVVIAILAILGSVGTVGYAGYIKKTNETADQTLVSDIEQALILGAYSKGYGAGSQVGYVFLSQESPAGVTEDDFDGNGVSDLEEIMIAAYGESWKDTLKLKSDYYLNSEEGNIMKALKGANKDYFASVPESSFYAGENATAGLATAVDELTAAFSGLLGDKSYAFGSFWGDDFQKKVVDEELDYKNDAMTAANLTVLAAANEISNPNNTSREEWINSWSDDSITVSTSTDEGQGYVGPLVIKFAKYKAYVDYVNNPENGVDQSTIDNVNFEYEYMVEQLGGLANGDEGYIESFNDALSDFDEYACDNTYYAKWQSSGQAKTDAEAFIASMAAVNSLEDTYVSQSYADMLKEQNAFTNYGAADILNTMVNYASTAIPDGCDYAIPLWINENGMPVAGYGVK